MLTVRFPRVLRDSRLVAVRPANLRRGEPGTGRGRAGNRAPKPPIARDLNQPIARSPRPFPADPPDGKGFCG